MKINTEREKIVLAAIATAAKKNYKGEVKNITKGREYESTSEYCY
jgi:hypothetical protein